MKTWRRVPSNHRYEVSGDGEVRRVSLYADGVETVVKVHHLVLEAFVGPCPPGHECNHKDGKRSHNQLGNLEWVTPLSNQRHSWHVLERRAPRGSRHGQAKLTEEKVRALHRLKAKGYSYAQLATRFRVSKSAVAFTFQERTWTHV